MEKNDFLLAGFRFDHMNKYSGYDQLHNYITCDYIDAKDVPFGFIKTHQKGKRINLLFLDQFVHHQLNSYKVIHLLYGDDQMLTKFPSKRKAAMVSTVHLLDTYDNKKDIIRSIDGIITLSSAQKNNYSALFPEKKIAFIPHGFEKPQFYNLGLTKSNAINIFIGGANYRDINLICKLLDLYKNNNNYFFHLVGLSKSIKRNFCYSNVKIYDFVNDDEYYSLMFNSQILLLPLTFATANNVLLEAQFLGKQLLLPKIDGIIDYALPCNRFYTSFDEIISYINNYNEKTNYSQNIISEAEKKYSWKRISEQVVEFYNNFI